MAVGVGVMVRVAVGVTGVGISVAVRVGGRNVVVAVGVMVAVGASRITNFCPMKSTGLVPLRLFNAINSFIGTPYAEAIITRACPYCTS